MPFASLLERRILFWGLGNEGETALRHCRAQAGNRELWVLDEAADPTQYDRLNRQYGPLRRLQADAPLPQSLAGFDWIVKTPGVSLYRSEIAAAQGLNPNLQITSGSALWLAGDGRSSRSMAVTGTKGKSSTASLIAHCLRAQGGDVALGGNIGTPLLDLPPADWWILELSSYQAADLPLRPRFALLTNLYPAHQAWHGSTEQYFRDKLRLLSPQSGSIEILNAADAETVRRRIAGASASWYQHRDGFHLRGRELWGGDCRYGPVSNPALSGDHARSNLCAALTACEALGADPRAAFAATASWQPLPHRQEYLGQRDGLHFIDDSIATVPEATLAALQNCRELYGNRPVTLLLGGQQTTEPRHLQLATALDTDPALRVICLPDSGDELYAAIAAATKSDAGLLQLENATELADGVAIARRITPPGGIVLLSPGAPSYGRFRNFEQRGQAFRRAAGLSSD